ncbi:MAG: hypothetical protein HZB92_04620 [Euryarchaeota archaeon]|nr:hypothetical protein [Euryarchaeota archaeon]
MFEGWMDWLWGMISNPWAFLLVFFVFCFLAAIILPIPVEIGLLGLAAYKYSLFGLSLFPSFFVLALVLALGKGLGAWAVFYIGVKIEEDIRYWLKWRAFQWLFEKCTWLVSKLGYLGLYIILIIPLMTDTVPLYLFSLMNRDGKVFNMKFFVATNLLAGFARAINVGILFMAGYGYMLGGTF